jgi:alpha-tubulin suppressor-like RCC1 family protein
LVQARLRFAAEKPFLGEVMIRDISWAVRLVLVIAFLFFGAASAHSGCPQASAGLVHTIGVKSDGTVVAVGDNFYGQCDVGSWTDIVQVSTSLNMAPHTVGVKSDGTVVAAGYNSSGQCDVGSWTDIVQVSAGSSDTVGSSHTVGVKSDGTVVAVGYNFYGQCDVGSWTDIVQVSAGSSHTVGVKSDGTVVAAGYNSNGQCDIGSWTDILQASAGFEHTVGVKSDGTVVVVGATSHLSDLGLWTDIVQVSAGWLHTVGVKSDGTVVAVGANSLGQCDVGSWTDIVQVSPGSSHTVGVKSDGTVVAVGGNVYGQCGAGDWNLCVMALDPTEASFGAGGGDGQVAVDLIGCSECTWSASSNPDWITITDNGTGAGDGAVFYSVAETASSGERTGAVTCHPHPLRMGIDCNGVSFFRGRFLQIPTTGLLRLSGGLKSCISRGGLRRNPFAQPWLPRWLFMQKASFDYVCIQTV